MAGFIIQMETDMIDIYLVFIPTVQLTDATFSRTNFQKDEIIPSIYIYICPVSRVNKDQHEIRSGRNYFLGAIRAVQDLIRTR